MPLSQLMVAQAAEHVGTSRVRGRSLLLEERGIDGKNKRYLINMLKAIPIIGWNWDSVTIFSGV